MKKELIARLNRVNDRIRMAAARANRNPARIRLVAVGKNHPVSKIKVFNDHGVELFGENRVQELRDKQKQLEDEQIKWHFVGHLQRNKVKYLMRMSNCLMIESLDSWRLAREIDKRARRNNRKMPVLVEVNIARDQNKYGIMPEETLDFLKEVAGLEKIKVRGLMTVVPYAEDPEQTRPYFHQMSDLKDRANSRGFELEELSMGMTNDFEVAIEEGATIVRIGTALFGKRDYE
ncbi:MAG: YggS family pyridoxal phosphate-dependent enzyme [Bacillota bacterium]